MIAHPKLNELDLAQFLQTHWQKQYLFIRQAFPDFSSPISPEILAGFALEEEVHSRLVTEKPGNRWQAQHGPFDEKIFSTLPQNKWTLLVQNVDALDENVNTLLNAFRFIPNWRLDDIMISYAADQGSVGPHFDYYDVFLLQAQGKRRWKIGQHCDAYTPLLPDQDMKILASFEEQEEFILEPGDMLYLPPGVAHWGIAEGECMTISVGFRAPSRAELLLEVAQEIASELNEDHRYSDPNLNLQDNPGEIQESVIENIQSTLNELINNKQKLADIFGRLMTRPKHDIDLEFEQTCNQNRGYQLIPTARCAYYGNDTVTLFVNGECWSCSEQFAKTICSFDIINKDTLNEQDLSVFNELLNLDLIINREE